MALWYVATSVAPVFHEVHCLRVSLRWNMIVTSCLCGGDRYRHQLIGQPASIDA